MPCRVVSIKCLGLFEPSESAAMSFGGGVDKVVSHVAGQDKQPEGRKLIKTTF